MIEADRVLRPLDAARPAIEQLETYESPAALSEALRATWRAVDTTLRVLLRGDARVPDEIRLAAMSREDLGADTVVTELRRRDMISLTLAGRVHELMQSAERAERGEVHARDADIALEVVQALRAEVGRSAEAAAVAPVSDASPWEEVEGRETVGEDDVVPTASGGEPRPLRRPILLAAVAAFILVAAAALVYAFGRSTDLDDGIAAFRAGRGGVAEQHFRVVLQRDRDNVTARLYLSRILRDQSRHQEAAELLREAARIAPRDAAVRRELGYLFIELNRPEQAVTQFRQAVELEPEEPLGWVGLVQALRRAGNTSAAELALSRAPASAQAMIRTRQP